MEELRMTRLEYKFAEIIWDNEPVRSGELAKLCFEQLEWKRTTMYTVLKKLCEKGIFQNVDGVVTSLLNKEEYQIGRGEFVINEAFEGSLPMFIAAFTKRKRLTAEEIAQIQQMIDDAKEG